MLLLAFSVCFWISWRPARVCAFFSFHNSNTNYDRNIVTPFQHHNAVRTFAEQNYNTTSVISLYLPYELRRRNVYGETQRVPCVSSCMQSCRQVNSLYTSVNVQPKIKNNTSINQSINQHDVRTTLDRNTFDFEMSRLQVLVVHSLFTICTHHAFSISTFLSFSAIHLHSCLHL